MACYNANLIANYFIFVSNKFYDGEVLSDQQLQKLCYYASGIFSSLRCGQEPLFSEDIKLTNLGPTINNLSFDKDFDFDVIQKKDKNVLQDVFSFYGQYSARKLIEMSCDDMNLIADSIENNIISSKNLYSIFKEKTSLEYRNSYNYRPIGVPWAQRLPRRNPR